MSIGVSRPLMSTFSQAQALLRLARAALKQQGPSTPFQRPLSSFRTSPYGKNACRQYATAFERSKPHVNVGTYSLLCLSFKGLTWTRRHYRSR